MRVWSYPLLPSNEFIIHTPPRARGTVHSLIVDDIIQSSMATGLGERADNLALSDGDVRTNSIAFCTGYHETGLLAPEQVLATPAAARRLSLE